MFEFNTWVTDNLISGVKNRAFSREWAAVQLANYYVKGKVTEADISRFDEAMGALTLVLSNDDNMEVNENED